MHRPFVEADTGGDSCLLKSGRDRYIYKRHKLILSRAVAAAPNNSGLQVYPALGGHAGRSEYPPPHISNSCGAAPVEGRVHRTLSFPGVSNTAAECVSRE